MDRVNMSIAILPMSKDFNWNSTTVGLVLSSFFWGYLLTQIVGSIWADKIGENLVLGFGVVWWSITTILTPIAAKIGLTFLLVMFAFMGIEIPSLPSTLIENDDFPSLPTYTTTKLILLAVHTNVHSTMGQRLVTYRVHYTIIAFGRRQLSTTYLTAFHLLVL